VKKFWEKPLFALPASYARFLRYEPVDSELRDAMASHGIDVGQDVAATPRGVTKWAIAVAGHTFILRLIDESLVVSEDIYPHIGLLIAFADRAIKFVRWRLPAVARRTVMIWTNAARKRIARQPSRLMVNVGAGAWYTAGWKVLDHSGSWYGGHRPLIDYEHDLHGTAPMPFADRSVHLFYSEHVLEHLPDDCDLRALKEMHRCLVDGGGCRIVVPDADLLVERLRARDHAFFRRLVPDRPDCIEEQFLVLIAHPRSCIDVRRLREQVAALPQNDFLDLYTRAMRYDYARAGEHINWFNFEKLRAMLAAAGFRDIVRSSPQASIFQEIRGPMFDTRPSYSLHVDALK